MAITTTVAETATIAKTKEFLKEHGVDIDCFNQSKQSTVRSMTVILVKNFPFDTKEQDLWQIFSKFGAISKLVLPETKACAVIEFMEPSSAQYAFQQMAYGRFHGRPLFLEWAPIHLFRPNKFQKMRTKSKLKSKLKAGKRKLKDIEKEDEDDGDERTKLVVKNIAFEAQGKELRKLFGIYGNIKSLRMPTKPMGGHRGFCFIDFESHKEAKNVINALSASHFYGRHLVIEWEQKSAAELERAKNAKKRRRIK